MEESNVEKLILSDLENELQRGYRLLKPYEKAMQMIESLRGLEADAARIEKRRDDANAEMEKKRKFAEMTTDTLDKEIAAARQEVEKAKTNAAVILEEAEKKAVIVLQKGKDALADERKQQEAAIIMAASQITANKKTLSDLSTSIKTAQDDLYAIQASVSALKTEKQKLLEAFK